MGFDCSWILSMEVLRCPILSPLLLVFVFYFGDLLAFDDPFHVAVEEGLQSNDLFVVL